MSRTIVDVDDAMLAMAQQQLGTKTKKDTINRALGIAAGVSADDRARGLAWLQEHADLILDFDVLAQRERSGNADFESIAKVRPGLALIRVDPQ